MSILVKPKIPTKRSSKPRLWKSNEAKLLMDLANMRDDGIRNFRKNWEIYAGRKDDRLIRYRDELQLLWSESVPVAVTPAEMEKPREAVTLEEVCGGMTPHQQRLFEYWHDEASHDISGFASLQGLILEGWLKEGAGGLHVDWPNGFRPEANSLPAVLAWGCLMHAERLGLCRNQNCPTRYFIAARKDQRYCSQECAAPAKKAAKRDWWNKNRGKSASTKSSAQFNRKRKGK